MLQRVQAELREVRRVDVAVNAEDSAHRLSSPLRYLENMKRTRRNQTCGQLVPVTMTGLFTARPPLAT